MPLAPSIFFKSRECNIHVVDIENELFTYLKKEIDSRVSITFLWTMDLAKLRQIVTTAQVPNLPEKYPNIAKVIL